jgi:polysaccharide biosynthesis protein PslG
MDAGSLLSGIVRPSRVVAALILALSVAALLATTGDAHRPTSASASASGPPGGVNIRGGGALPLRVADREIALATALHAKLVRTEIAWSDFEPRGPAQLEPGALAYLDRLTSDAAASGIKVIALVDGTPCWASSAPPSLLRQCNPERPGKANSWPPRDPSAYAAFVAFLAQRYGARLAAIEIWNEPDQANEKYFAGLNKPERYAELLRAAYPAIKQADPGVPVIAGSLVGYNGKFLRALYAAGIKGYYDGLAVHFYTLTLASLRQFRSVQLANGDSKPLWLDEFGWSSCWPHKIQQEQACVTRKVQARNIANMYRALSRTPYIAADVLYKLRGSGREDFGVLGGHGARKPAFAALAHVLASPFGAVSPVTLRLRRRSGHVVASGSAPVGDYIRLEAFEGGELRFRALFTLNRFNRYSIALPPVLGTNGLRVRVWQDWLGLARAAQKRI